MVGVAQLVEHRVVVPGVAGSSPVTHPPRTRRSSACGSDFSVHAILATSGSATSETASRQSQDLDRLCSRAYSVGAGASFWNMLRRHQAWRLRMLVSRGGHA